MNSKIGIKRWLKGKKNLKNFLILWCICVGIIFTLFWTTLVTRMGLYAYTLYDRRRLHHPYTFMFSKEDGEYVTFERVGETSYKVYFHNTPENSKTDYIVTHSNIKRGYPLIEWTYFEGNKISLSSNDSGSLWIDSIVSIHYEFYPYHNLLRKNSFTNIEDSVQFKVQSDSIWHVRNYKLRANTLSAGEIEYYYPTDKPYREINDATIVKRSTTHVKRSTTHHNQ